MADNPNSDILLTEDGHPVGELVIADDTALPMVPNEEVENDAREAALRRQAQELTGNPDADVAIAELYPGIGDTTLRERALRLFVVEDKSLTEISEAVGVPPRTVAQWVYVFHWDDLKKREIMTTHALAVLELARVRDANRVQAVREQLEEARTIRRAAMDGIKEGRTSVKSGAEAWAAASKVEHTLLGVSEAGSVANVEAEAEDAKKDGAGRTLVMVFNNQQGGLPPVRRAR